MALNLDNVMRVAQTPEGERKLARLDTIFVGIGVLEAELSGRRVYVEMSHGRYWQVRRNGATKRWKKTPNRFAIPVKAGMKIYATICDDNLRDFWLAVD